MPTSSHRSSCPIIRVPVVPSPSNSKPSKPPKDYVRCPECYRKWMKPEPSPSDSESPSDTESDSEGGPTPADSFYEPPGLPDPRDPSRRPRSRPGSMPCVARSYPPRHDWQLEETLQSPPTQPGGGEDAASGTGAVDGADAVSAEGEADNSSTGERAESATQADPPAPCMEPCALDEAAQHAVQLEREVRAKLTGRTAAKVKPEVRDYVLEAMGLMSAYVTRLSDARDLLTEHILSSEVDAMMAMHEVAAETAALRDVVVRALRRPTLEAEASFCESALGRRGGSRRRPSARAHRSHARPAPYG